MEKIKEVLKNLAVFDILYQAFDEKNIDFTDENLKHAGFGFHNIIESFDSTIIMQEHVGSFVERVKNLQQEEKLEQPFALLGFLQLDEKGSPFIIFDDFVGNDSIVKQRQSASYDKRMLNEINQFLRGSVTNKVLLLGHTHPIESKNDGQVYENIVYSTLSALENNPLQLRNHGLNISVADIAQLVHTQEQVGRNILVLSGIVLSNGEFNIIFYDGTTIQSLDHIYWMHNGDVVVKQNFRNDNSVKPTMR